MLVLNNFNASVLTAIEAIRLVSVQRTSYLRIPFSRLELIQLLRRLVQIGIYPVPCSISVALAQNGPQFAKAVAIRREDQEASEIYRGLRLSGLAGKQYLIEKVFWCKRVCKEKQAVLFNQGVPVVHDDLFAFVGRKDILERRILCEAKFFE